MPVTAFIYAGATALQPEMAKKFYNALPPLRSALDRADKLLVSEKIKPTRLTLVASREELARPSHFGPALLAWCQGMTDALAAKRIRPQMFSGQGLGMVIGWVCQGAVEFSAGLKFLLELGRLMESFWEIRPFHSLLVSGKSVEDIFALAEKTDGRIRRIAVQSPDVSVLTGEKKVLEKLREMLQGPHVRLSAVEPAWYWPMYQSLIPRERVLACMELLGKTQRVPAECVTEDGALVDFSLGLEHLIQQYLYEIVDWPAQVRQLRARGMDTCVHIDPTDNLMLFTHAVDTSVRVLGTDSGKNFTTTTKLAN